MEIRYRSLAYYCRCSCGEAFFVVVRSDHIGETIIATCPNCNKQGPVTMVPDNISLQCKNRAMREHVAAQNISVSAQIAHDILDKYRVQLSTTRMALFALEGAVIKALRAWKHRQDRPGMLQEAISRLKRALHNSRHADIARQERFNKGT